MSRSRRSPTVTIEVERLAFGGPALVAYLEVECEGESSGVCVGGYLDGGGALPAGVVGSVVALTRAEEERSQVALSERASDARSAAAEDRADRLRDMERGL